MGVSRSSNASAKARKRKTIESSSTSGCLVRLMQVLRREKGKRSNHLVHLDMKKQKSWSQKNRISSTCHYEMFVFGHERGANNILLLFRVEVTFHYKICDTVTNLISRFTPFVY